MLRVVFAEDNYLIREGTAALLGEADVRIVGTAASLDELLAAVEDHEPEVVLTERRRRRPGYLLKERVGDVEELIRALGEVAKGGSVLEKHINSLFHKLALSEEPDVHRRVMAVLAFLREQQHA